MQPPPGEREGERKGEREEGREGWTEEGKETSIYVIEFQKRALLVGKMKIELLTSCIYNISSSSANLHE